MGKDFKKVSDIFSETDEKIEEDNDNNDLAFMIKEFFDVENNLDAKTEFTNVIACVKLHSIIEHSKSLGFPKYASVLENFLETYKRYMISNKRLGRTEILEAFRALNINQNEELSKGMQEQRLTNATQRNFLLQKR